MEVLVSVFGLKEIYQENNLACVLSVETQANSYLAFLRLWTSSGVNATKAALLNT